MKVFKWALQQDVDIDPDGTSPLVLFEHLTGADDQDCDSWLYCCWGETNDAIQKSKRNWYISSEAYQLTRYQYLVVSTDAVSLGWYEL